MSSDLNYSFIFSPTLSLTSVTHFRFVSQWIRAHADHRIGPDYFELDRNRNMVLLESSRQSYRP